MRIFFSHSSRDKALLRELREHFPPWLTSWLDEDRLLFGGNLQSSLRDAIDSEVDYVVIFLGQEAANSQWVKREVDWALDREKALDRTFLLPVVVAEAHQYLESLGLHDRVYLSCTDQSKEAVRGLASNIVNHVAGWMAIRLNENKRTWDRLAARAGVDRLSRYQQIIASLAERFSTLPTEWHDDVERLVLKPLLGTAQRIKGGRIPLDPGQYYRTILREIERAGDAWKIFAVSLLSSELWVNNTNQKAYAKRNLEAAARGADIHRLFIVPVDGGGDFKQILEEQNTSGMKVRVADMRMLAHATGLDDLVIFRSPEAVRVYVCYPAIDDPRRILSGRMVIDRDQCDDCFESFMDAWNSAMNVDDYLRSPAIEKELSSFTGAPGLTLPTYKLGLPVITCEEAAAARGVALFKELKTLIVETSSGLIAVHLPGDARLSLRAVKAFLEAEEAYVADPETLFALGLSPGTVSAILEPVWSMPHLISRRVFDSNLMTTNNRTKTGYFSFDPVVLTHAKNVRIGEFEQRKRPNG